MHVPMGINPKTPLSITITAEIFTKNLEDMHLNVTRHVFQDLGGMGDINSVEGNEGNDLQDLLDPGGAPQDTTVGYTANVDTRHVPGTPRKEVLRKSAPDRIKLLGHGWGVIIRWDSQQKYVLKYM